MSPLVHLDFVDHDIVDDLDDAAVQEKRRRAQLSPKVRGLEDAVAQAIADGDGPVLVKRAQRMLDEALEAEALTAKAERKRRAADSAKAAAARKVKVDGVEKALRARGPYCEFVAVVARVRQIERDEQKTAREAKAKQATVESVGPPGCSPLDIPGAEVDDLHPSYPGSADRGPLIIGGKPKPPLDPEPPLRSFQNLLLSMATIRPRTRARLELARVDPAGARGRRDGDRRRRRRVSACKWASRRAFPNARCSRPWTAHPFEGNANGNAN